MPKPGRPCNYPHCPHLAVEHGYCAEHKKQVADNHNQETSKYYTYQWHKRSRLFLNSHPLCVICDISGRVTAATCVDHIQPHQGDMTLFWDESNWQALCDSCHSSKTAKEVKFGGKKDY
jgi:5-methylcytosine-specific restriction protein A